MKYIFLKIVLCAGIIVITRPLTGTENIVIKCIVMRIADGRIIKISIEDNIILKGIIPRRSYCISDNTVGNQGV